MPRPKKTFVDILDTWLETATIPEMRDALRTIDVWLRVRNFGFRVRVEDIEKKESPK